MPELLRKIAGSLGERHLAWAVNLLLLLLVLQALMDLSSRWLEPAQEQQVAHVDSTAMKTSRPSAQELARKIAGWHLFGHAQSLAVKAGPTVAPETKLNLVLSGVIASPKQKDAVAIISAGGRSAEKSYAIDDRLPGGAKLKEVYGDRVIIEYRGRVETLTLHRKKLTKKEFSVK